mmetsp:Transcript_21936/g.31475  ORF Transcript_21936/g.31475 Transcript_21936/m.31475 type:complete len:137 (-) Transcript_21936:232-642(-)
MWGLTTLNILRIGKNEHIGGYIPTVIGQLTNLVELRLESCSFTGTIPSEVGILSNLELMDISNNSLHGTLPTELALLTGLDSAVGLKVANHGVTGPVSSLLCDRFSRIEFCNSSSTNYDLVEQCSCCAVSDGGDRG